MTKWLFTLILLVVALPTTANELNITDKAPSPHKWFVSSQSVPTDQFDLWQVDSGYSYSVFDSVELYVGARLRSNEQETRSNKGGLLSGIKYNFSDRLSVQSAIHTSNTETETQNSATSVELSSQLQLSEQIDLRATMDYEALQQVYQIGIGFKF
ncbi:hypothetical protein MHO82_12130 [Vibrio sp. Of7-15]|uniref:hypothetical protein n=1 Tax=Vibrio sp. Of7-15 TaxID=2724879 RepID=UPI001EF312CE|nr:hypothetical protein [Vibrio sp. Of7-15]MCG7497614.1 hypothetical protein [Vibrio sp. Of7-15]